MSILTYNGITLPYAHTTRFDQSPVYEEVGHTDWYCTKFEIVIQAILNKNHIASISRLKYSSLKPTNAAEVLKLIRFDLLRPRMKLEFKFNDIDVIPEQTAGPGTVDVKNGPMPQSCTILQLTNETFIIEYHIVAHYWENNSVESQSPYVTNNPGSNVLFNRWTETIEMDDCMYSRRIREGKFAIRSDNGDGITADYMRRAFAVVGIPKGFLRESSTYTQTADGLGIAYRIVDKEVYKMPPRPAHQAKGTYIESSIQNGARKFGEVRLMLRGNKGADQADLVRTAITICTRKLAINGAAPPPPDNGGPGFTYWPIRLCQLLHMAVVADMYDNVVEVHMKAMLLKNKWRFDGCPFDTKAGFTRNIVYTPFSDEQVGVTTDQEAIVQSFQDPPPYLAHGTAGYLLTAAAYYDPSLANEKLDVSREASLPDPYPVGDADDVLQMSEGLEIGTAGVQQEN